MEGESNPGNRGGEKLRSDSATDQIIARAAMRSRPQTSAAEKPLSLLVPESSTSPAQTVVTTVPTVQRPPSPPVILPAPPVESDTEKDTRNRINRCEDGNSMDAARSEQTPVSVQDQCIVLTKEQTPAYCLSQVMPHVKKQTLEAAKQLARSCQAITMTTLAVSHREMREDRNSRC